MTTAITNDVMRRPTIIVNTMITVGLPSFDPLSPVNIDGR